MNARTFVALLGANGWLAAACEANDEGDCRDRSDCGADEHCFLDPDAGRGRCVSAPGRDEPVPGMRVFQRPLPVGVLLVIDDAPDGLEPQRRLLAAVPAMVERAQWLGVRLHVGVTTTSVTSPICEPGTTAHSGMLASTSCLDRLDDFIAPDGTDITSLCTDVCARSTDELGLSEDTPWIDVEDLAPEIDPVEALSCLIPQGVSGCEHGAPLLAAHDAVTAELGFRRLLHWNAGLGAALIVTPGVDCSITPPGAAAFDPAGDRSLWTDPDAAAPTPAVCWRAGVQCRGDGPVFDACDPVDVDPQGLPVADGESPVLMPLTDFNGPFYPLALVRFRALIGIATDGETIYTSEGDPAFVEQHGIAAGCRDDAMAALPPVRLRESVYAATSICSPDYDETLAELIPELFGPCLAPEHIDGVTVKFEMPNGARVEIPECDGDDPVRTIPEGAPACYAWRDNPWVCPAPTASRQLVLRAAATDGVGVFYVEPDWLSHFDTPMGW
jgi:hypothetical protein